MIDATSPAHSAVRSRHPSANPNTCPISWASTACNGAGGSTRRWYPSQLNVTALISMSASETRLSPSALRWKEIFVSASAHPPLTIFPIGAQGPHVPFCVISPGRQAEHTLPTGTCPAGQKSQRPSTTICRDGSGQGLQDTASIFRSGWGGAPTTSRSLRSVQNVDTRLVARPSAAHRHTSRSTGAWRVTRTTAPSPRSRKLRFGSLLRNPRRSRPVACSARSACPENGRPRSEPC